MSDLLKVSFLRSKLARLAWQADIVIVCGLYKTGTSLAVELCSRLGFMDISRVTNHSERGVGLSIASYYTRECAILRKINEAYLGGALPHSMYGVSQRCGWDLALRKGDFTREAIYYLQSWPRNIVLKDVRFIFTLPIWVNAALKTKRRVGIIFTYRNKRSLSEAWDAAPFTRPLLWNNKIAFLMESWYCQIYNFRDRNVSTCMLALEDLKILSKS